ncbi:MAG: hypothetical protein H0X24_14450 [Ktedonobacterales bacterium]|nr:hypothetical protein [Ktedonobacterales bacterium]
MRKHRKRKQCCCALCKPLKRGLMKRWKPKEYERLRRWERDRRAGWYEDA